MQRLFIFLGVFLVVIFLINFDNIVKIANDFKEPALDIEVGKSLLGADGTLTAKVTLKNVTESPIFVDRLGITYIVFIDDNRYEFEKRDIEARMTIDGKNQENITVVLPGYVNPKFEPSASQWIRNKRKKFGIKISVKDNFDKIVQWTNIKLDS